MSDLCEYRSALWSQESDHENICIRCGICCGADNDPCRMLRRQPDGTYLCADYDNRLGPQLTSSGKEFNCVMIRQLVPFSATPQDCAYTQRQIWRY